MLTVPTKRLIESVSPRHGRALIYVWAIEQDNLSKRNIPASTTPGEVNQTDHRTPQGQDVFVPWVLSSQTLSKANVKTEEPSGTAEQSKIFHRYYHMFARGELRQLVEEAAFELDLEVGSPTESQEQGRGKPTQGLEITQDGWERSNYYVELRKCDTNMKR